MTGWSQTNADLFEAAASFREKLNITADSHAAGLYLTSLVLSLDFYAILRRKGLKCSSSGSSRPMSETVS